MGRIQIVNTHIGGEKYPADLVLHRKTNMTGSDMSGYINTGSSKIKFVKLELPEYCPICFTQKQIVNYTGEGKHFRCLACDYKW